MHFSSTSSFAVVAIFACIGTLQIEASPSPIRYVTPKPGIDYRIRVVTPNPRIRYLRSVDEEGLLENPIEEKDLTRHSGAFLPIEEYSHFAQPSDEDVPETDITVEHAISKRSPERVVINYRPPPANGPRYARSANAEEAEEFMVAYEDEE
ncbi:uncharacterized protein LOC124299039 [Neodiprion virginianus]|uniref:Uncharacterized protein LOC107223934 n=1 Tax=Neodiprion lecontei TaxID=441921 RepID=A0A6J0BYB0_NEOLC|nr:uncharacterized protein LOC107223934 [Neodiprion lecontei]XP_046607829.1 uncharacterized protein LOC124299039 [Neodiprion virginianus]